MENGRRCGNGATLGKSGSRCRGISCGRSNDSTRGRSCIDGQGTGGVIDNSLVANDGDEWQLDSGRDDVCCFTLLVLSASSNLNSLNRVGGCDSDVLGNSCKDGGCARSNGGLDSLGGSNIAEIASTELGSGRVEFCILFLS